MQRENLYDWKITIENIFEILKHEPSDTCVEYLKKVL